MERVSVLHGIFFNFKDKPSSDREVGVIAQEVETVLPEAVSEDAQGYKSVDYSKLTPLLIEAIKTQQAQIQAQQAQIQAQQGQMGGLTGTDRGTGKQVNFHVAWGKKRGVANSPFLTLFISRVFTTPLIMGKIVRFYVVNS